MNKKLVISLASAALFALPLAALAINPGNTPGVATGNILTIINAILDFIWPIFVGFAVIMFLVAGFLFLSASGDASKIGAARQAVLWGVIGFIVGLVAFSIPNIVRNTLGI